MPSRLATACRAPGCPNRATAHGYCDAHQHLVRQNRREAWQQADSQRGSARERGYGGAWQRLRAYVLRTEPLCRHCAAKGIVKPATMVHHMDPISEGNPNLPSVDRLIPLCDECHAKLHNAR